MTAATVEPVPGGNAVRSSPAWDQAADGWNQHTTLIHGWLQDVTAAMLDAAGIAPGSRVLDIAAGAGDQTLEIARRVGPQGYVLATDISARILALAQENLRAAGLQHVDTRLADAQALGLAGSDFDAAVCRLGLMFCASPLDALTGAREALKPGGRLGAVVFSQPQCNPCLTIMMSTALKHAGLRQSSPSSRVRCSAWASLACSHGCSMMPASSTSTCSLCPHRFACQRASTTLTSFAHRARRSWRYWPCFPCRPRTMHGTIWHSS